MKICPACRAPLAADDWRCSECRWTASSKLGILQLSADIATSTAGSVDFDSLFELEAGNFWFRSRNRLILWAMARYFSNARSMMEIGCGTGFVLHAIKKARPDLSLIGTEVSLHGAALAAKRVSGARIFQMDGRNVPFQDEFDVVGAFDVIEHIEDDLRVLREIHGSLRQNGGLLLTVPQHPGLWSAIDQLSDHKRRYTRAELRSKVESAGFSILRCTSFVTLLLPAMWLSRLSGRNRQADPLAEFRISRLLNRVFETALSMERWLIRGGMRLPAGGSLLLVARKK